MANDKSLPAGHEESDANAQGLMWFGIALAVALAILQLGFRHLFWVIHDHQAEHAHPASVEPTLLHQRVPPPEPRLQSNPEVDLATYLQREARLLSTYGWIDKKREIARIPIERAMELTVGRREPPTESQDSRD